jgi:hypothetical protein
MHATAPALLRPIRRETFRIAAGADVARSNLAHALLRVRRGRVWITQHRDIRDYILVAGEAVRIDSDGPVVIQALRDAEIDVVRGLPPARRSLAARDLVMQLVRRLARAAGFLLPATPH